MVARGTFWLDKVIAATVANGAVSTIDLMASLAVAETRGLTLVRLIYNLNWTHVSPFDTQSSDESHMGIGLIENDASSAGAFPDPQIEGDAPGRGWVVRDHTMFASAAGTSGNLIYGTMKGDIRAMRRIVYTHLWLLTHHVNVDGAAQSARLSGLVRCLFKLP